MRREPSRQNCDAGIRAACLGHEAPRVKVVSADSGPVLISFIRNPTFTQGNMNLGASRHAPSRPAPSAATTVGPDIHDTRLLSEPAVSAERIAFIYANDLWTSDLEGRNVRRLTSDVGVESSPTFSPDGKWIAFSAQYEGNTDVYVVGSEGGVPKRRLAPGQRRPVASRRTSVGPFTSPRNVTPRATLSSHGPGRGGAETSCRFRT